MSTPELPRYGPPPGQLSADPLPDLPPTAPMPDQPSAAPPSEQPSTAPPAEYGPPTGQPQYPKGRYPGQYLPGQPPYPYPYPQQPGYGQPPYPSPYPYPKPARRSNRTLWIVLGAVGGVVALLFVGGTVLFGLVFGQIGGLIGPIATASSFCADEEQSDYASAYALLSTGLQRQYGEAGWYQANQTREAGNGVVQNCGPVSSGVSVAGNTATIQLQLALNDGTHTGPITLVKEGSQWKIDSIDLGLGLVQ